MDKLTAQDLMTKEVVSVPPTTPVYAVARLLAERGISAVPVLEGDEAILGVVTEADVLRRLAGDADEPPGFFRRLFANPTTEAARFTRTFGITAGDIMTRDVITVGPEMTAPDVAHLLEERNIRRVFVVSDGRLRGIVSRADLLRAVVAEEAALSSVQEDRRIRADLLEAMREVRWASAFSTAVEVKDGIVEFFGYVRSEEERRALKVLAERVPGVKGVSDRTGILTPQLYPGI